MKNGSLILLIWSCILLFCGFSEERAKNKFRLKVEIVNIKSSKGKIMLELFNSGREVIEQQHVKIADKQGDITFSELERGEYAIRLFHDENDNNELDTGSFGKPVEGYGHSNNVKGVIGPPKLKDQLFTLKNDTTVQIKMIY